jgi:class 3 adenylate cyclase
MDLCRRRSCVRCHHPGVARLTARERARLPDRVFAYIDSQGNRRLPIHDAPHIRNALARFNQVAFEDDDARDRARTRLLNAAKRHGIMPIGFVNGQLQPQRKLPKGEVTFLMTDLERSTELVAHLGDGYASLLTEVRGLIRAAVRSAGGHRVDSRGDDFLAVFESPAAALSAALEIQGGMCVRRWPDGNDLRLRIGLHRGRPTLTDQGYVGLSVHTVARICFAGHGGQVLMSGTVHDAVIGSLDPTVRVRGLGAWRFEGLPDHLEVFQADLADCPAEFPPLRAGTRVRQPA